MAPMEDSNFTGLLKRVSEVEQMCVDHNEAIHGLTGEDGILKSYHDWIREFTDDLENLKKFLFEKYGSELTLEEKEELAERLNLGMDEAHSS
jgi:hypothetical protein